MTSCLPNLKSLSSRIPPQQISSIPCKISSKPIVQPWTSRLVNQTNRIVNYLDLILMHLKNLPTKLSSILCKICSKLPIMPILVKINLLKKLSLNLFFSQVHFLQTITQNLLLALLPQWAEELLQILSSICQVLELCKPINLRILKVDSISLRINPPMSVQQQQEETTWSDSQ